MPIYAKVADDGGKWVEIGASSGGGDLVGGVAGWAAIESVTGSADLATLKADGIAPASATADADCPGTYNITADGVVWRVAVFTGDGSITTSGGVVDALILGSGSSRSPGSGASNGAAADAGGGFSGFVKINDGTNAVLVGQSVSGNTPGIESSLSDVIVRGGIGSCGFGAIGTPEQYTGITSDITGTEIEYGVAAGDALLGWGPQPVSYGSGSLNSGPTPPGAVVVRAPKDAAQPWEPAPELPGIGGWATVQSITGPAGKRYTYNDGPGGVGGTDWVAYEWTDGGSFTVTDGIIETLTVGSGGYGAGGGGVGTVATGGVVLHTLQQAAAGTFSLSVAPAASSVGETPANGSASTINFDIPMTATGGFNGGSVSAFPPAFDGYEMLITGESMWCGGNSVSTKTGPGFGGASRPYKAGKAGVVIIRVPAANALATIPGTWGDL